MEAERAYSDEFEQQNNIEQRNNIDHQEEDEEEVEEETKSENREEAENPNFSVATAKDASSNYKSSSSSGLVLPRSIS